MDFGRLIGRSIEITLRNPALWLFGFLLSLFGGGGGANFNVPTEDQELTRRLQEVPPEAWLTIGLIAGLVLLVIIIVSNVARAGLIGQVNQVETTGATSIREGWGFGWSRFAWRNFLIGLLLTLFTLVVVAVMVVIFVLLGGTAGAFGGGDGGPAAALVCLGLLCFLPLFIVFAVTLYATSQLAYRHVVLQDAGVRESLAFGWRLLRSNLGNLIILVVITIIIGLIWFITVGFVALLIGGILGLAPGLLAYFLTQSGGISVLAAIPGILLTLAVLAALNTLWTVFAETLWTLTYRALPNRPGAASEMAPVVPAG